MYSTMTSQCHSEASFAVLPSPVNPKIRLATREHAELVCTVCDLPFGGCANGTLGRGTSEVRFPSTQLEPLEHSSLFSPSHRAAHSVGTTLVVLSALTCRRSDDDLPISVCRRLDSN